MCFFRFIIVAVSGKAWGFALAAAVILIVLLITLGRRFGHRSAPASLHDENLILDLAIGGSWGGAQGIDDSIFPARMVIDYVRVYQTDLEKLGYNLKEYQPD